MRQYHFPEGPGRGQYLMMVSDLLDTKPIQVGEWQAMDVSKSDLHKTHELEDVSLVWERMPRDLDFILPAIDHEWADEHHLERVSGRPLNPAPSHVRWPYAVAGNARHTDAGVFDHTYPERFWPKFANLPDDGETYLSRSGVRFNYGDLNSVVNLLVKSPLTRQAVLPVWFPEDTGAEDGQRVPCTIAYHFMQREGRLSCRYYIRSCDVYRHLSNDVYFAAMLTKWICDQVTDRTKNSPTPMHFRLGGLVMHISSLHAFVGDVPKLRKRINQVSFDVREDEPRGWPV